MPRISVRPLLTSAIVLLTACATTQNSDHDAASPSYPAKPFERNVRITPATPQGSGDQARLFKGTGQLVKGQLPGGGLPPPTQGAVATGPSVALNFEAADLRDVVRNILTDILGESYTIEPQVGGTVTIRTTSGIPREALPATLEMLLRMNGAAMVKEGNVWKILPASTAVRGNVTPQLGNSARALQPGFRRADRAVALHERAADGGGARAFRQGSYLGARRRHAKPADPLGDRAGIAPPL